MEKFEFDKQYFKEIKTGLAYPPDVENYYNKLCEFLTTNENLEFKEANELITQRDLIEEIYGFKQDKPVKKSFEDLSRTPDKVLETLDDLIDRDLPDDELLPIITYLSRDLGYSPQNLLQVYRARQEAREDEALREEFEGELSAILRLTKVDLSLEDFLPPTISNAVRLYCNNSQVRESIALIHLLSAMSICHTVGTKVRVDPSKHWYEPTNLFTMMVSPSGQGKSPILNTLITNPLWDIQKQWAKNFAESWEEYDLELEAIKAMPKEQKVEAMQNLKRPPDRPPILFATDLTVIGVNTQFNAYPTQGIMGLFDEARKLFAMDRTSSKHSDHSDILTLFNGGANVELRADGVRTNIGNTLLGLMGAIQPDVLMDWMNIDDFDGQWARFIFCVQPLQRKLPSRDGGIVDIEELVREHYKRVLNIGPTILYDLSSEAAGLFDEYYYGEVEDARMKTTNSGLASLYGKSGSKIARFAVNLHCFDDPHERMISPETMQRAILLDRFFTNQTKILYSQSQALAGELAPKLAQIVQISRQVGELKARVLQQNSRAFKKDDPTQIRKWFKQLEAMHKGQCKGSGTRLSFKAF